MGGNTQTVGSSFTSAASQSVPPVNQSNPLNPNALGRLFATGGEGSYDRSIYSTSNLQLTNQTIYVTPLVALRSETCTSIASYSSNVNAVGTTLAKMGVYQYDQFGNATLLAGTVNDVTLWTANFTQYKRSLVFPFNKIAGNYYGLACLWVGATTAPGLCIPAAVNNGGAGMWSASMINGSPPGPNKAGGVSDLPQTIANANINIGTAFIMEVLP